MILFILATLGLTNIIVHGRIMDVLGIRPWLKSTLRPDVFELFECYECTGWWAGLIMGIINVSLNPLIFISCAFAGALLGHLYSAIYYLIESRTSFEIGDIDEQTVEEANNDIL